jgi:hypothetical protein
MAEALFRAAAIPRRLMPAAIALGTSTFTMSALPGTRPKTFPHGAALDIGSQRSPRALANYDGDTVFDVSGASSTTPNANPIRANRKGLSDFFSETNSGLEFG